MKGIRFVTSVGLIFSLLLALFGPPFQIAQAAALTGMSATLSTLKISTVANQTILFTLSATGGGIAAGETITLTYDSDFAIPVALDFEDIDVSTDATPDGVCDTGDTELTLAAAASGTTWGAIDTSTTVITITSGTGTIAASVEVCVEIGTNAESVITGIERITNATTAASRNLTLGGTNGDTGTIVITTVTDDVVVATATVAASLSFSISDNDIFFGTLSTSASKWADNTADGNATAAVAHTLIAGTNSTSGYTITVQGATLTSTGTPGDTITAMGTEAVLDPSGDVEQFGLRITAAGGSGAVDTNYDNTPADTYFYGANATTTDVIATSAGVSADTTYSLYYAANIASSTEAHTDYTASLTYVATGNF
ncbi:MAG: hypothetical protein Q8Q38_00670 [bacterium]|nr:hypothetical protein [bacterium]